MELAFVTNSVRESSTINPSSFERILQNGTSELNAQFSIDFNCLRIEMLSRCRWEATFEMQSVGIFSFQFEVDYEASEQNQLSEEEKSFLISQSYTLLMKALEQCLDTRRLPSLPSYEALPIESYLAQIFVNDSP